MYAGISVAVVVADDSGDAFKMASEIVSVCTVKVLVDAAACAHEPKAPMPTITAAANILTDEDNSQGGALTTKIKDIRSDGLRFGSTWSRCAITASPCPDVTMVTFPISKRKGRQGICRVSNI